jgi:cytochrome c
MKRGAASAIIASVALLAGGHLGVAQQAGDAMQGESLARNVCAACHAVESGQTRSPNTRAPTFETVAATQGMTAMALRVWLQSPHPTMPNLMLTDEEKDDVIAYILSLRASKQEQDNAH